MKISHIVRFLLQIYLVYINQSYHSNQIYIYMQNSRLFAMLFLHNISSCIFLKNLIEKKYYLKILLYLNTKTRKEVMIAMRLLCVFRFSEKNTKFRISWIKSDAPFGKDKIEIFLKVRFLISFPIKCALVCEFLCNADFISCGFCFQECLRFQ